MVKANFMSIFNTDMTILLKFFFAEILLISLIFLFFDQKIRTIKKKCPYGRFLCSGSNGFVSFGIL